jgi:small GTP-binding protein
MIQKKVCLLGASSVGKTSLVRRFVHNLFSDKYLTTIGVKIDRKEVNVADQRLTLMLWDIEGEDQFARILPTYIRGAAGCLLVADGTRAQTLDKALDLGAQVAAKVGEVPALLLINKADLKGDEWDLEDDRLTAATASGWTVIETSAKDGRGVEEAFLAIARGMLGV